MELELYAPSSPRSVGGLALAEPPLPSSSEATHWLEHLGQATLLSFAVTRSALRPRTWLAHALHEARVQLLTGLPLVLLLTALGGALISQQTGYQFQGNLPTWVVGSIIAASLVTEVTPLLTGIAAAGVVGTRISAELGAMSVTEQVDALRVMGRDPVLFLVVPRVVAGGVALPVLVSFGLAVSMLTGWGSALMTTNATSADFWFGVRHYMRDFPLFYAVIKAVVFGVAINGLACYAGLEARGGSAGVGRATRAAVVAMITAVVVLDTALVPLLKVM